ncbi:MAG: FAD-dependent oxidoreductase, partial [Planctomycetota bacterium]
MWDVLIAGGGMAGAALAIAAARAGLSVALVEARDPAADADAPGRGPERVIALSYASRDFLHRLGVWDAIAQGGAEPIREVHVREPGMPPVVRMRERDAGLEALGYVARNDVILRALYDALPPSVHVLAPAAIEAVEPAGDVLRTTVRRKRRMHPRCRLLVGADGANSRVRTLCGIGSRGWDHNRFGIVASVRPRLPHRSVAHECFRP